MVKLQKRLLRAFFVVLKKETTCCEYRLFHIIYGSEESLHFPFCCAVRMVCIGRKKRKEIHVFGVNIPLFYAVYAK